MSESEIGEPGRLMTFKNVLCGMAPTEKQQLFLEQRERKEVFFGGAAGGGKSVALLMAAMEYIRFPGYAALILRKDFARMELAGGLIQKSHEWFGGHSKARWVASRRQWFFPFYEGQVPAMIMFGYLNRPLDKFRYASSEFQYIAFDELTEISEEDYLFLFSRLRRNTSLNVPLRMRSASNPGGPGHLWVKERFIPEESGIRSQESGRIEVVSLPEALAHPEWNVKPELPDGVLEKYGRFYIPSRIGDNKFMNEDEYRGTLMHLPAVERERLMNGDWSVQEEGKFHVEWFRYFVGGDQQVELLEPGGRIVAVIPNRECRRYVTIDPAGTSEDAARDNKGWSPSWSVVQVWDQPPAELAKFLLLRHEVRQRVGFETLCEIIRQVHREWRPLKIWIEGEKLGLAAISILKNELPIESVRAIKDKVSRAARLIVKMERGEIFLPRYETTWRPTFEQELLAWTGHVREVCDQIDAAAHAANQLGEEPKGPIRMRMGAVST